MNPFAFLAFVLWVAFCAVIVVLFGVNGAVVIGVINFFGLLGVLLSAAVNY